MYVSRAPPWLFPVQRRIESALYRASRGVFARSVFPSPPTTLLWSTIQAHRTCFTRLRILDSTSFLVPADYGEDYRGSVSSGAKIQFEYDLLSGACLQLCVQSANDSDARFAYHAQHMILPNDLCIRDLGFFSIATLTEIDAHGAYYITRLRSDMKVYIEENSQWKEWD